MGPKNNNTEG